MDLTFTEAEEEFRHEARSWLEANVPSKPLRSMDTPDGFEQHREWEKTLRSGRWCRGVVARGVRRPRLQPHRVADLRGGVLPRRARRVASAPTASRCSARRCSSSAREEQKDRFLPKMASGDEIWAQGWSEPNAGSDLASLKTKAVRDGEWFVVNGQKTWCSRGAFADWIFCIFRSDPEAQRHKGLTYFLVPADTEGMTAPRGRSPRRRTRLRRAVLRQRARARVQHPRRRGPRAGTSRWRPPRANAA